MGWSQSGASCQTTTVAAAGASDRSPCLTTIGGSDRVPLYEDSVACRLSICVLSLTLTVTLTSPLSTLQRCDTKNYPPPPRSPLDPATRTVVAYASMAGRFMYAIVTTATLTISF
ncbi:hypothetical protein BaRGS_00019230 [Batillaria attramentaria]|uniref:Uncharacterized protein n=1 Tax=Batillaria attramentaria TaxID=370345 RepID=A0ABD0KQN4_9CAEN